MKFLPDAEAFSLPRLHPEREFSKYEGRTEKYYPVMESGRSKVPRKSQCFLADSMPKSPWTSWARHVTRRDCPWCHSLHSQQEPRLPDDFQWLSQCPVTAQSNLPSSWEEKGREVTEEVRGGMELAEGAVDFPVRACQIFNRLCSPLLCLAALGNCR